MSDFFKVSPSAVEASAKKEALLNNVRQELATANAQTLMTNLNEACYKSCVPKPGPSLSSSETTCLDRCFSRYMEAFNIVSQTYVNRLSKEKANLESTSFM